RRRLPGASRTRGAAGSLHAVAPADDVVAKRVDVVGALGLGPLTSAKAWRTPGSSGVMSGVMIEGPRAGRGIPARTQTQTLAQMPAPHTPGGASAGAPQPRRKHRSGGKARAGGAARRWRRPHRGECGKRVWFQRPACAEVIACFFALRAYLAPPRQPWRRPCWLPTSTSSHPTRSPARTFARCVGRSPRTEKLACVGKGRGAEAQPKGRANHDPEYRNQRPRSAAAPRRSPPSAPLAPRRGRSLRPPDQALEPEDAAVHLRRPERDPYHRP